MECIKIVKEYEVQADNDVVCTDDLPIKVGCACSTKGADRYELKFTLLSADAGVNKYSINPVVKAEGEFYYYVPVPGRRKTVKYIWFPIFEPSNVLEFSVMKKEITMDLDFGIGKESVLPLIGYDFTDKNEANDTILVVGGQNFHVNKAILSLYSPFFNSLLNNKNFEEANKSEIELKDLDAKEFEVLLQVIHPTNIVVNADNVEFLWKLADRFCITSVAQMCETFICNLQGKQTGAFLPSNRLKMAELYNSEKLKAIVMKLIDQM